MTCPGFREDRFGPGRPDLPQGRFFRARNLGGMFYIP
jgi:hypothetical protein